MTEPASATGQIPVLETGRLRLRGHRLEDFADSFALWSDPNVTRFIGGKPLNEEDVWSRLMRYAGHWSWMGFGYWVVEEKSTGLFAGEVGFADWKREIEPSIQGLPEAGWVLASRAHGKGYATEAVRAIIAWGDKRFQGNRARSVRNLPLETGTENEAAIPLEQARMVCIIDDGNTPSVRVAEKCGFRQLLSATYHHQPIQIFTR
jgi:RimJ/RimL family protein N-acetyltransferase